MSEELYIGFESYLNNEMTAEEKLNFQKRLQDDLQFKESFDLYQQTTQFLDTKFSAETIDFQQNLKSISSAYFNDNKKSKIITFKPWQYAVAASVVLLLGTWFFMQNNNPEYGDYSQHEAAYFTERSAEDSNLKMAQDLFNAKDYKNAVSVFEKIDDLKKPELQYFYAIALIETNDFSKAEVFLNRIKDGNSIYKDKAIWYLALSNLKQNKIPECKLLLKQIPEDAEDFAKAQQLLKDLD